MAKKKATFIPQEGIEFTADWFTDLFQEQYGAAVLDVSREVIGTGVGFVGEIHRCSLSTEIQIFHLQKNHQCNRAFVVQKVSNLHCNG